MLKNSEKTPSPNTKYFASRYNFFFDRPDGTILFNARTGTFAKIEKNIANLLQSEDSITSSPQTAELLKIGAVHLGSEINDIVNLYNSHIESNKNLNITIVPTLECNRSCTYCYQNEYKNDTKMSKSTQNAVINYIKSKVTGGHHNVAITWYGGEPLLELGTLLEMSKKIKLATEHLGGVFLPGTIITNGALLTDETSRKLKTAGIETAQITIDSLIDNEKNHRGIIDLQDSISLIGKNAKSSLKHLNIQIRINTSRHNESDLQRILDILKKEGLEKNTYLARVSDYEGEVGAIVNKNGTRTKSFIPITPHNPDSISRKEYSEIEFKNFLKNPTNISILQKKLTPKKHFCGATSGSLYVIDPEGYVSRCWLSAGAKSESLGNVNTIDAIQADWHNKDNKWSSNSPFIYQSCITCQVLPLCMGGCSHPRVFMDSKKSPCESVKFQIQSYINQISAHLDTQ